MGNMNVAQRRERFGVTPDGLQPLHRDLNIDNGLRLQPWNGSRTVMVYAACERSEFLRDSIPLDFEFNGPAWIV